MATTNVTSLIRRLQDWVQQPAQERNYLRGPLQMVDAALADSRRTTQLSIASSLLGTWYLARGEVAVLGGAVQGFDEARLGTGLLRAALLLRCPRQRGRGRPRDGSDLPHRQAAHCICLGLALGDPDGDELAAAYAALPETVFGDDEPFPLFVHTLLQLRDGARGGATPRLGPYFDVVQAWNSDPSLFARCLAGALDFHLDETRGSPGNAAAFDEPGVMLFPAEALAVRAVRRELDLPWPKVEHPLMFTNLVTMAPEGPWPTDSLLARIERAADQ